VGLPSAVRPGDVVLVKGSRGVGLEAVVRALRVELAPEREDG
jgi:UDP-N-acetylmuramyl pentapeptide synthase